jgi:UDP-N-acetylmuramate--alanine ligase
MKQTIDIDSVKSIHFIGIGGIGMSALARHFLSEKKVVSGSDATLSDITKKLAEEGVLIYSEQSVDNIAKDAELVVYTEAITKGSDGWTELQAAKKAGIPTINYFEALGLAMNPYYLIAVAGTHGKTTTTAMTTELFEMAEKDPTAVIGSLRAKTKSNYRAGKSKYAIVEACEYKEDFLSLRPDVLVITNLEHDHVDYYETLADVQKAFRKLIEQVNENGVVITDTSSPTIAPILEDCPVKVIDYKTQLDISLHLKQPGVHNLQNAAAALTVAKHEGLDMENAKTAIEGFTGTWRRFEYKGILNGAPVYDDYAHHPTEIKMALSAMREAHPEQRIVAVFEPHTYTRTVALFKEFAQAFAGADEMVVVPIYAAREENTTGVSSRELAVQAIEYAPHTRFAESLEAAESELRQTMAISSRPSTLRTRLVIFDLPSTRPFIRS